MFIPDDRPRPIIGLDCAAQPQNMGLALGRLQQGALMIEGVHSGGSFEAVVEQVLAWLNESSEPVLLAFDAPLGWPAAMGQHLAGHAAGDVITPAANDFFRRETDRFMRHQLGKQSLDVGADRIARAAHSALRLLQALRQHSGRPLPLAWQPSLTESAVIEVYPAATLQVCGIAARGYKGRRGKAIRVAMLKALAAHWQLALNPAPLQTNDNVLDAAVCLLAGADFLQRRCFFPLDETLARKEGWMWVRRPQI